MVKLNSFWQFFNVEIFMSAFLRALKSSTNFPWKYVHNALVFDKINFKTHKIKIKLNVQIAPSRHWVSKLVLAFEYFSSTKNANIFMIRSSCSSTARIASYLHAHLASLSDFSYRDNNSPSTSISLKEATLFALPPMKLYKLWIVPKAFFKFCTEDITVYINWQWKCFFH